jgi:hypothetical protein
MALSAAHESALNQGRIGFDIIKWGIANYPALVASFGDLTAAGKAITASDEAGLNAALVAFAGHSPHAIVTFPLIPHTTLTAANIASLEADAMTAGINFQNLIQLLIQLVPFIKQLIDIFKPTPAPTP